MTIKTGTQPFDAVTLERMREVLNYDPATGVLTWVKSVSRRVRVGERAGCLTPYGYRVVRVFGHIYPEHRVVWFLFYGEPPPPTLDHRDGQRDNNRIHNLRPATRAQNQQNRGRHKHNRSGHKGVRWDPTRNRWRVEITCNGKRHFFPMYRNLEDAVAAYAEAAERLHGPFARAA